MKKLFPILIILFFIADVFAGPPTPPSKNPDDTAYNATSWDGNTDAATKNAIRDKIETMAGGHDAVTLDTDADAILDLSTQQLQLDSQNANTIFAGPSSGAAADPDFRALVDDDIPDDITITESDPIAGAITGIVKADGAGNISAAVAGTDYVETEADPGVTTHESTYNHANYNTAYGWGDHSSQNYLDLDTYPNADTDSTDDFDGAWGSLTGVPANIDTDSTDDYSNPMTTQGDIIYGGASGAATRLAGSASDDYVLAYDTATNAPYWKQDADSGGATAYDDIGDPDASGSIAFGSYTGTYTSATDGWGGLLITNTPADNASDTTLLTLGYAKDAADTNNYYLKMNVDQDGTPATQFYIKQDALNAGSGIAWTIAGTMDLQNAVSFSGSGDIDLPNDSVDLTDLNIAALEDIAGITQTQGDILYSDGSNWLDLAKGTAYQILQMNSGATAPEWTSSPSFTELNLPSSDASPSATAGQIRHDSTVTGLETGALAWWDGDEVRYIVDLDVLPSDDGYVVAYNATNDNFEMVSNSGSGDSVSIDSAAVTDPDFVSTGDIDFVDTANTITANINEDSVDPAHMADGDHGDFSYSSNSATLDTGVVLSNEIGAIAEQKDFTILTPADADDCLLFKAQRAITITDIHCIIDPGDTGESISVEIYEYDGTGDNGATVDAAITADNDGAEDDGTLSNGAIDAGDWVGVVLGAPSGTVSQLCISIYYTEDK